MQSGPDDFANRFLDACTKEDLVYLGQVISPDCLCLDLESAARSKGLIGFYKTLQQIKNWSPNLRFQLLRRESNGTVRWKATGTHCSFGRKGEFLIEPVTLEGRFVPTESNGKWTEVALFWGIAQLRRSPGFSQQPGELAIRITGEKPGVPLVFVPNDILPGWRNWARFTKIYSPHRPVINLCLTVNQCSLEGRPVPEGYSFGMEVESVRRTLLKHVPGPFDVVGWSIGGMLALDLAIRSEEQVRSLAVIEPTVISSLGERDMDDHVRGVLEARMKGYAKDGVVGDEGLARFLVDVGNSKTVNEAMNYEFWPLMLIYRQSLFHRPTSWSHQVDLAKVASFRKPVLIFKGDVSIPFYGKIADSLHRRLRDCRVEVIHGAHRCYVDDLESFLRLLGRFHEEMDQNQKSARKAA